MSDKLRHRKAERIARITDAQGRPLANTKIRLQQTNHEFLFGCGAFDFIPAANTGTRRPDSDVSEEQIAEFEKTAADRVEKWLEVYNYGTLPFYWGTFEREEGKPMTEPAMNAVKLMRSKGIRIKGHPLCWHTVCADWLLKYDNATILRKQLERIDRDVTAFKGSIDMWDVINEVVIMPIFDKYDNALTRLCKEHGRVKLIKTVFDRARAANPDAELLLNDFNTTISYQILIDGCLNAGVPIDTIGIQSHQHQGYWGREKLEEVLERFEVFGKPIHFTENTLVSGSLIPPEIEDLNDWQVEDWPTTPEFEQRQMEQTEEMYRVIFEEHPLVKAITGWDFADGAWLGAPSGVVRKDNSVKPVYTRLKEMIKGEWWTDCELTTDADGKVTLFGFKGDYLVSAGDASAPVKLTDGTEEAVLELKP